MQPGVRRICAASLIAIPLTITGGAHANERDWDLTPRASISQTYSDNIELAPPGEEEYEHITQLNAGFSLDREGAIARTRLDYDLLGLVYWRDDDRNDVLHRFLGDTRITLSPERFFIDADATYRQRLISGDGAVGDELNVGTDRSDVLTLRVSPVLIQTFDDVAEAQLRYTHDRVDYRDSEVSRNDSESNRVLLQVESGPLFSRTGWAVTLQRSKTDFDDGDSVMLQAVELLGRYGWTERLSLFAGVGDERNRLDQGPLRVRLDDTFWRIGATFTGGERTFAEAFVGERFFGTTYGGTLRYLIREGELFATYDEGLTTSSDFDLIRIAERDSEFADLEPPDLRTGAFLRKRFNLGASRSLARTDLTLRAFDEQREFQDTGRKERAQGVVGSMSWRFRPRTHLDASASIEDRSFADIANREDTLVTARIGLRRDLGRQASASIAYQYRERDSNVEDRDYRENRVTATFRKTF